MDYTFNGQIEWKIVPQSLGTDLVALDIEKQILSTGVVADNMKGFVGEFAIFMSVTKGVRVPRTAPDALKSLVELIGRKYDMSPQVIWETYLQLPNTITDAWREAFKAAQVLFPADVAQLPTDGLTDEQKEAATDPASPLAWNGGDSHSD